MVALQWFIRAKTKLGALFLFQWGFHHYADVGDETKVPDLDVFLIFFVFFYIFFFPVLVNQMKMQKEVYRKLKEVPEKALAASGYSEVNLAKLFQAFSSLK